MIDKSQISVGRVISSSKSLPILEYIEVVEDYVPDESAPTLIVGKKRAEGIFGKDRIKVLDKKIENNVYWTFAKNERRVDFEKDVAEFNEMIIKLIKKSVTYEYFNIFTEEAERSKKFIEWLYNGGEKIIYIYEKHLYIYSSHLPKKIFGFSLNDVEYIGKDIDSVLSKISNNKNNVILDNNNFLGKNMKAAFFDCHYIVPYLYFIHR